MSESDEALANALHQTDLASVRLSPWNIKELRAFRDVLDKMIAEAERDLQQQKVRRVPGKIGGYVGVA